MPGIDNFTKLMLHGNGTDGSTSFPDSSDFSHTVVANGDVQVDTAQSQFGGAAILFDGIGDYLSIADNANWDFGSGDFTIDLWARFSDVDASNIIYSRVTSTELFSESYVYISISNGIFRLIDFDTTFNLNWVNLSVSISNNTWYHIAISRSGTNFRLFIDGTQVGSTFTSSNAFIDRSVQLEIGQIIEFPEASAEYFNGWIDEFRWSKGIARWTTTFSPPIEEYSAPLGTIEQTIFLDDNWQIQPNPTTVTNNETIFLSDLWAIAANGDYKIFLNTLIHTVFNSFTNIFTYLTIGNFLSTKYDTDLRVKLETENTYNTDLRVSAEAFDVIQVGSLDDYLVKLDGIAFDDKDIDYLSINITYNLNSTPSTAEFTLSRRHDDLDRKLDTTPSIITAENKIEIYDGDIKLFTGYITEIFADSNNDTVRITASDIRYKLLTNSMELKYGGDWLIDSNGNGIPDIDDTNHNAINDPEYIRFEKNIGTALLEVFSSISGYISGYDNFPFSTIYVPEFVKTFNTYANLIDELLKNTTNVNWYTDENERLRFQVIDAGTIKEFQLASLNEKRHPYDTIINDIRLNRKPSNYARSLEIELGTNITKKWNRSEVSGWLNSIPERLLNLKDKTIFDFQQYGEFGERFYVGINQTIYGYFVANPGGGWYLKPTLVFQWQTKDTNVRLDNIIVGSGEPKKKIFLNSYGIKIVNKKWEEKTRTHQNLSGGNIIQNPNEPLDEPWLVSTTEESYDRTGFAEDLANFELSQNNKLETSATIEILLDAYEYYNIKFSDRINLINTIYSDIYKNNNGFPLNINSVRFNLSNRTVSLNVTNSGKSAYTKTANYMTSYYPPTITYLKRKEKVQKFTGNI